MLYHDCVVLGRYCIALLRIQSILFPFQGSMVLRHSLSVCVLHLGVLASSTGRACLLCPFLLSRPSCQRPSSMPASSGEGAV